MIEHIEDIRLLVVDDSNVQRQHAQGLAQQLGVTAILGASDGADALRVRCSKSKLMWRLLIWKCRSWMEWN